ncbi:hypothetical protein CPAR01_06055 [Colletotrichum paranaense]|uniref:Uncharacterized protein n=1 Tax=Colletotrichum paranaense TaxID=1914294 RepID=A0ABQ9ST08_9PEZI|nr:uncharacterized protein CPAR01_06055 [Colletotrichum paranaense]KAK1542668.1 hypothetical protein CPAR01_06055 [Colletotrichum paranaense]
MTLPWIQPGKRRASEGEHNAPKRKRVEQRNRSSVVVPSAAPRVMMGTRPEQRQHQYMRRHRRTMAVGSSGNGSKGCGWPMATDFCLRKRNFIADISQPESQNFAHRGQLVSAASLKSPVTVRRICKTFWFPYLTEVLGVASLCRNPANVQVETDAGYNLAKMSDLKPDMSVQEKLILGLRTGLQRRDEYRAKVEQDPARLRHESRNDIMAFGGIDMTDLALALPKSLRQKEVINAAEDEKRRLGFPSMEVTLPDRSPAYANEWWDMYNAYIRARSMFVKGASLRLTAVSRPYNKTVHSIPGVIAWRRADQIMNIEWQPSYHGMSMNKSFSAFQARSMELNGYRRRSIQYVHFQRENNGQKSFPGGALGTNAGDDDDNSSFTTERFFERDRKHKLSLIDLDITDINGVKRRWVCIEITKPLAQVNGPAPIELTPMPQSFIKIAIPCDSILVVVSTSKPLPIMEEQLDKMEPPQLGDFDKLTIGRVDSGLENVKMRLKISGDGVPIFVTGSKKGHMPDDSTLDDFLCASDVTGLPWKETDRRVSKSALLLRKAEFWDRFNLAADADKVRWESLQDAMASDECIVDITFEGDWQEFAPVAGASQSRWTPVQHESSQSQHSIRPQGLNKGQNSRHQGNTAPSKSSGLRNEVHW